MKSQKYNTNPLRPYDGPEFEEFCISKGKYLSSNRNRFSCSVCPLANLCTAGFEEQVRRVKNGEDPSLTGEHSTMQTELSKENLLRDLTDEQISFIKKHIFNL